MAITNEQRKALKAVAAKAAEVAELIRQRDQAPINHPLSDPPRRDLREHGPDLELQNVERLLGGVVAAIRDYLRRPPEG